MNKPVKPTSSAITWERALAIFGDPKPVKTVWQRQFDYNDDVLQRLARTPCRQIDFADMWYYHHDLAYVELQPDLFNYLFPVCLMDWHDSLMRNQPCSHGDSEFHYGIIHGNVFDKMLTSKQRAEIGCFFRDSVLARLDVERGFLYSGSGTPAYGWMSRFNSLGLIMPEIIEAIWTRWWNAETPGQAVCLLQYCSGLIYAEGENVLFGPYTCDGGGGGPYLWENDSWLSHAAVWQQSNVDFLRRTLLSSYVLQKVRQAADRLIGEPEEEKAQAVAADSTKHLERIESRIVELPMFLEAEGLDVCQDWSV